MNTYRPIELTDCEAIAVLHAESWRQTYRGILTDEYLDGPVGEDRYAVWQERFANPAPNQRVLLAEENGNLLGFICLFLDEDPLRGTLIDNLHVDPTLKGRGIGSALLHEGIRQVMPLARQAGLYLYVYEANVSAIRFYNRMGGTCVSQDWYELPGGGQAMACCYAWPTSDLPV